MIFKPRITSVFSLKTKKKKNEKEKTATYLFDAVFNTW